MSSSNIYNFWNLIKKYSIEIPIIQRDYAQGKKNNDRIDEIRNSFLDELFEAITQNKNADLNFIYGKVHNDTIFIPLDGQQRLTTLYLLHWYAFLKEGKVEYADLLKKFSYEVRTSSRNFCSNLIDYLPQAIKNNIVKNYILSSSITDEAWFFDEWKFDPTIQSMLYMLDAIHAKFKDTNELVYKLINTEAISFRFLNTENLGLEDSLYIKINARGKSLTDFENFKAKLLQYIKTNENEGHLFKGFTNDFEKNIDGRWTDLFWNYRDKANNTIDNSLMNFIHLIICNTYAALDNMKQDILTDLLIKSKNYSLGYYEKMGCLSADVIEMIFIVLNGLCNINGNIYKILTDINLLDKKDNFETIAFKASSYTYQNRAIFYAITNYLYKNSSHIDKNEFTEWLRVMRNLIYNTIDNNVEEFSRSIKSIKMLTNYSRDILSYLKNENCSISRFLGIQVEEEEIKAKLMSIDQQWIPLIKEAENHKYYQGQIGFLLSFAKIKLNEIDIWTSNENEDHKELFITYYKKAISILGEEGLKVNQELWSRALLTKGDYLIPYGRNLSFLINYHRDISWKALLRDDKSGKREFVRNLLDEIDIADLSLDNINNKLESIISTSNINDWRKYFIKLSGIIPNNLYRLIRKENNADILILEATTTAGYNKEYYSYALFKVLADKSRWKKENSVHYTKGRGINGEYYIDRINGYDTYITYNYVELQDGSNKYAYLVSYKDREYRDMFDTQDEIINFIERNYYVE